MLSEIRKEAFMSRKTKSTSTPAEVEDEEDADEPSSISDGTCPVLSEDWELWYPQEWVGWIIYGLPSDSPTEHWVNQPISEGPTDTDHFITDNQGKRVSKKPPGRSLQRHRESSDSTVTRTTVDNNTMMSQRLIQVENELEIANSSHNFRIIELLQRNAVTDDEKALANNYYREYLLHESELLAKRLAEFKAVRENAASHSSRVSLFSPTPAVSRNNSSVSTTDRSMHDRSTPREEISNSGELIKSLNSFGSKLS